MKFDITDIWSGGLFLLLTITLFIFVLLVRDFSVIFSAVVSGTILIIGVALMIYVTIKND